MYVCVVLYFVLEVEMKLNVYIKKIIELVLVDVLNVRFKIYFEDINKEYFIKNIGDFLEVYMNKIEY